LENPNRPSPTDYASKLLQSITLPIDSSMIPCTAMFAATSPSVNCRKAIGGRQQQAICVVTALSQSLLVTDHMVDWMLGLLCHNQLAADSG